MSDEEYAQLMRPVLDALEVEASRRFQEDYGLPASLADKLAAIAIAPTAVELLMPTTANIRRFRRAVTKMTGPHSNVRNYP
jgi:hypothetical protein